MAPERLAIVGTGLIGASVALAAKRGRDVRITGFDSDPAALGAAVERGAVDSAADSLEAALADAELAVVAAPVAQLAAQVRAALEASPDGCTVTDVGSTKVGVCSAALGSDRFVGGHPVCGSEARGAEHAGIGDGFTGAEVAAADDVEAFEEMVGEVAAWGHCHAGTGMGDAAAWAVGEHRRGAVKIRGGDAGARGDVIRREGGDGAVQGVEAGDMVGAESGVVPAFGEDDVDQAGGDRDILAGLRLDEEIGVLRGFGVARIDDDQLEAARLGVAQ